MPSDDDRVRATVAQIIDQLTIDRFVYRFVPRQVLGDAGAALGQSGSGA